MWTRPFSNGPWPWVHAAWVGALLSAGDGCGWTGDAEVPADAVARVGPRWIRQGHLDAARDDLDAFGQLRFGGEGGRRDLVASLIDAELLRQRAEAEGLDHDGRARWAAVEALAAQHLAAELERRAPRATVAADEAALAAYYSQHADEFINPERRGMRGVFFDTAEAADEALARLREGRALDELGDVVEIPPAPRDDAEFPAFHRLLFTPGLVDGDLVPSPVYVRRRLLVGRVNGLIAAAPRTLSDPTVRDEIVDRVRAPLLARARLALLEELRRSETR
ncbi:MAG: peptidyl-prolyl cis-trans isomerase [Myxococcales bacterium FL481]|nr:MAG: peptidyl-prolyl cis-trans isomerase [Myxococcales bacterium FL481]